LLCKGNRKLRGTQEEVSNEDYSEECHCVTQRQELDSTLQLESKVRGNAFIIPVRASLVPTPPLHWASLAELLNRMGHGGLHLASLLSGNLF
jgi:hypothetical protein